MNSQKATFIVIAVIIVMAGLISISWAQGGPGRGQGRGQGSCQGEGRGQGGDCTLTFDGPMDDTTLIKEKLAIAIDDEYHAKAVYASVLEQFGDVRPFSKIIVAEQRHIDALTRLYEKYGIEAPADSFAGETFEFADLKAAAQAAVDAEIANADLYDDLLQDVTDPDVITVFEKPQWASREKHLPAFENYLENGGSGQGQGNGKGRGRRGGGNGGGRR